MLFSFFNDARIARFLGLRAGAAGLQRLLLLRFRRGRDCGRQTRHFSRRKLQLALPPQTLPASGHADQKWKSRFGKSCHFPDSSGAGQGRRLGAAERPFLPPQLVPRLPEGRSTLLTPLLPHTRPRSPAGPFPHLLLPSSEKSLVPEPVYAVALPLPAPTRVPPPAIATATTSVPLNRFLLHVNTYSRKWPADDVTQCTRTKAWGGFLRIPRLLLPMPPLTRSSKVFLPPSTVCSGTGPPARSPGLDPLSLSLWGDETKSRFHCPREDSGADTDGM